MFVAVCLAIGAVMLAFPWVFHRAIGLFGDGDLSLPQPGAKIPRPNFEGSIACLAVVRLRILETQQLDEKALAAIDTLTLALVKGSDQ